MKKVISFTFALIFAVCVSLAAFADEDASNSHVTSFENIINVYIENQHKTTVTDPTGSVITEEYFSAIMPHYLQHDYGWIEDYTAKTVGELSLMYVQGTSGARGLGITKNVRGYVSKYFYGEKNVYTSRRLIMYTIDAVYVVDRASELITSTQSAKLVDWTLADDPDTVPAIAHVSTSSTIKNNGGSADFIVSANVTGKSYYQGVEMQVFDFGNVKMGINCSPDGSYSEVK